MKYQEESKEEEIELLDVTPYEEQNFIKRRTNT